MTLAVAIYQKLCANTAVAAAVGDRIYPLRGPDNPAAPYVIFQLIASPQVANSHAEAASATIRLVQFACFARTYEAAAALRDSVVAALDNVVLGNGDIGDLEDDSREDYDSAAALYRCDCDLTF